MVTVSTFVPLEPGTHEVEADFAPNDRPLQFVVAALQQLPGLNTVTLVFDDGYMTTYER
jgi:hypothetical protein